MIILVGVKNKVWNRFDLKFRLIVVLLEYFLVLVIVMVYLLVFFNSMILFVLEKLLGLV